MIPNAATMIFGTVADPISHVTSCERFNPLFQQWQFNGIMLVFHVAPDGLAAFLDGVRAVGNLAGFCVTIPHKQNVVPLLDRASETAALVGAANVVRREADGTLSGDQLDGMGFVTGLTQAGHIVPGKHIFMAGAGGAAAGIGFALAQAGAARLTIYNRTPAKAHALAERIRAAHPSCDVVAGTADPAGCDIAINSTSAGMRGDDPLPFDVSRLSPSAVAAEVIMKPRDTAFLQAAARLGCPTHYGDAMLLSQLPMLAAFMGAHQQAG